MAGVLHCPQRARCGVRETMPGGRPGVGGNFWGAGVAEPGAEDGRCKGEFLLSLQQKTRPKQVHYKRLDPPTYLARQELLLYIVVGLVLGWF